MSNISILSLTQKEFAGRVKAKLGKGETHASLLYSEWYRQGEMRGETPAFKTAQVLLNQIIERVDGALPELLDKRVDGETTKFLTRSKKGLEIESVIIPMGRGSTLCVSSQVGCQMGCAFCETGRMGLLENLSCREIVGQVVTARHVLGASIRNIVFMGMGEPLDNLDNVLEAVKVLTDPGGLAFGPSNISISTSGLVEGIYRLIEETSPALNLAVSVNAPNDAVRRKIMPVNRRHDMKELKEAMEAYCSHPRRAIFAEYVLLAGVNDSLEQADELADYLRGLRVKINLIPYNAQSKDRFAPPTVEVMEAFAARLREHGYRVLLRMHKGRGIMAACGQLGNLELRKKSA